MIIPCQYERLCELQSLNLMVDGEGSQIRLIVSPTHQSVRSKKNFEGINLRMFS